jgi:ABC-2 type transport system permease protein
MKILLTIAKKEYVDMTRNALFLTLAVFLLLLVGISIMVASLDFNAQVAQYNAALSQFTPAQLNAAIITAPQYYPLQMLRGTIEYLEIIGAVITIILGYLAISKEKGTNISRLLLTRPLTRGTFIGGKMLGNSALILSLLVIIFIFIIAAITGIGHVAFSGVELIKLALTFLFTYIYLAFFLGFSMLLTLFSKDLPRALILAFTLWLVFILIIPQVGDTMDPDNQVSGGFFSSMHVTQDQQTQIIGSFQRYENLRNALEVTSVEKHYERLAFAMLGIKPLYNGKSLGFIMSDKWGELLLLLIFYGGGIGLAYAFATNKRIMGSSP